MKKKSIILTVFITMFIILPQYLPSQNQGGSVFRQEGIASWYGREFDGRPTASGEIYDSSQLTAAHPTLPFGTLLIVTNRQNNRQVTVRINDRGPFVAARIIDVSRAAAEQLDMIITGTAPVLIESVQAIVVTPGVEPVHTGEGRVFTPPQQQQQPQVNQERFEPVVQGLLNIPTLQEPPPQTQGIHNEHSHTRPTGVNVEPAPPAPRQPIPIPVPSEIRLSPNITPAFDKLYRLQVGSFTVPRNAVQTFERVKNALDNTEFEPRYEVITDDNGVVHYRVVIPWIPGNDVHETAEKLRLAGFREALIREDREEN